MDSHYETRTAPFEGDSHRSYIGGMWEEIGGLQFDFMRRQGLLPHHTLLDVGCGSLRGGARFIPYLNAGCYFGQDINRALIDAGIARELSDADRAKLTPDSFRCSADFDMGFAQPTFDFGLALSLFTHLSSNKIRLCLNRLRPKFVGGVFFATVFEGPVTDRAAGHRQAQKVVTYSYRDPYHYARDEIFEMAHATGWNAEWIGAFDHPRNQQMVAFR